MKFYSGFSLKNEEHFFDAFRDKSEYCICGFSYGALQAFKEVRDCLDSRQRVDRLQLFSPAFFQTKEKKFKRLQELAYAKSKDAYLTQFLRACFSPLKVQKVERVETDSKELQELLHFEWQLNELKFLEKRGVIIEVYLGGKDAIIDAKSAQDFFINVATVTYIKEANHFLQLQEG